MILTATDSDIGKRAVIRFLVRPYGSISATTTPHARSVLLQAVTRYYPLVISNPTRNLQRKPKKLLGENACEKRRTKTRMKKSLSSLVAVAWAVLVVYVLVMSILQHVLLLSFCSFRVDPRSPSV